MIRTTLTVLTLFTLLIGATAAMAIADYPVCANTCRPLGDNDISSPYRCRIHWLHYQSVAVVNRR